jgi:hypothetical protein
MVDVICIADKIEISKQFGSCVRYIIVYSDIIIVLFLALIVLLFVF